MLGVIASVKARHPERQFFQPWYKAECEKKPEPSPTPAADLGTPAPVEKEIQTIAFEPKESWEDRHKRATPKYERCIKRASKSKKPCAADRCMDAFRDYVWPDQVQWGRSKEAICKEEIEQRAAAIKCVRKALAIKDDAERMVSLRECGVWGA
jgi:hypothetical protein